MDVAEPLDDEIERALVVAHPAEQEDHLGYEVSRVADLVSLVTPQGSERGVSWRTGAWTHPLEAVVVARAEKVHELVGVVLGVEVDLGKARLAKD